MQRKWPLALFGFAFTSIATLIASADGPQKAATASAAVAPKGSAEKRVLITISKETTAITSPLRKDGYPDYIAALNEACSKGVTPQNNAVVLLFRAAGPRNVAPENRAEFFRLLGIPVPPERGDYFVEIRDFVRRQSSNRDAAASSNVGESDQIVDELDDVCGQPWSEAAHPLIAKWLAANSKPLDLAVKATHCSKFFEPLTGKLLLAAPLPAEESVRAIARALAARAMLHLHDGNTRAAWDELLTLHRLARLNSQAPTLVQWLVAVTIDGMAFRGEHALLQSGKLTSDEAKRMRSELAQLGALAPVADKIDLGERFMYLDCVAYVARKGMSSMPAASGDGAALKSLFGTKLDGANWQSIDWNVALRMGGAWYDRLTRTYRIPTFIEQTAELKKIDGELSQIAKRREKGIADLLAQSRETISQRMGDVFVALLLPATTGLPKVEQSAAMRWELTQLAFSLATYRSDHGAYPAKLEELVPKYAAKIPADRFTGGPLHYNRDSRGAVFYSVGRNGWDDGGRGPDDNKASDGWDDIVLRLPK